MLMEKNNDFNRSKYSLPKEEMHALYNIYLNIKFTKVYKQTSRKKNRAIAR